MKTNIFKLLTPIFILFLYGSSCKKDKEPTIGYIAQETKDFCVFKTGTWWEYQNVNTMQIDTWKVVKTEINITELPEKLGNVSFEQADITIYTQYFDTFDYRVYGHSMDFSSSKYFGINQGSYFDYGGSFKNICDNNNLKLISDDSLNGIYIKRSFKLTPSYCTDKFPNQSSWQRNIGITEMKYPNGDTLILKSYHIKQ